MYLADYHTHTRFSPDAGHPMQEMARAALAAGLQEICFTDHVDPVRINTSGELRIQEYNWAPLQADFAATQKEMGETITLRLGMELGDAPFSFAQAQQVLDSAPEMDFVIGSIHGLSRRFANRDLYVISPQNEKEARAGIEDYLVQVQQLADWGRFTVLGHLTLPLRYFNEKLGFDLTFDRYEQEVESIFRALIQNGCGIELNTNRGNCPLPDAKWLKLYRNLGGEIITIGTDAHTPKFVGHAVQEGQELLRACGFSRFCTFEKRKPIWHAL